ncbi:multidrug ABC transporter permease [Corynebacterium sp. HMSC077D10]|uniref:Multidrug ABC transporter permease n=1 Tax=Corynebacterium phoceense TaxID=1686286 RepID=A0A540R5I3_9CORY|nr:MULTISPECIES: ABC transporter permease [Corynebacterium]KXB52186.1 putative ABC transporter [Corynebacterium sp. DNF00584]OFL78233.1 multidrug ABC transporter permease [Corynebacterium sp. HMSC077B05]OFN39969.1 multidrug ABC transporter permease [Corynebacterium sp. HMSC072G08]OFP16173.1 multidrug ABC transporter permease [Corynebacterium sp. HMSC065A05]OFP71006.1 multidrug ABC transporter permease [Corynebacterium sp. HMSC077D10]
MTTYQPGTFTPAPQRAGVGAILKAQGAIESKLLLRHGEQQLLSIVIPIMLLIGGARLGDAVSLPGSAQANGLDELFPMVLAVAATSAGFTGQAISLAFDRRYGALKRTGASGVPAWAIIGGKIIGVASMVLVQVVVLGLTAYLVGFRTSPGGVLLAAVTLVFGVAAFTALGLILGGTMSSELVLALANLVWFLLLGVVGWAMYSTGLGHNGVFTLVPTVALAGGLTDAFRGEIPLFQILVLVGWAVAASAIAVKWFRFDG